MDTTHTAPGIYSGDTWSFAGGTNYNDIASRTITNTIVEIRSATTALSPVVTPPTVTNLQRFGFHAQPTTLVFKFNEALDPTRAQNVANYRIVAPNGSSVAVTSAVYDSAAHTVTLYPRTQINLHKIYTLTVIGTGTQGVSDPTGSLLDGASNGKPGSNFVTKLTAANLVLTDPPGGPLRLKHLRRAAAKIAAHEHATLAHASTDTRRGVQAKGNLHV
jgi:hypothetical protein